MLDNSNTEHFLLVSNYTNSDALVTLIFQIERLHKTHHYSIHVITENQEEIDLFEQKLRPFNLDVHFYAFDLKSTSVSSQLFIEKNGVARIAYAKIFAANILPTEITKVVYLDTDILILKPLCKLFDIQFSQSIAACVDAHEGHVGSSSEVFNSGVMVLNLSTIREKWSLDVVRTAVEENLDSRWMDMTILRRIFLDDWFELPTSFNFIINGKSQKYFNEEDIAIVHFAGYPKPWTHLGDSIFDIYWEWLNTQALAKAWVPGKTQSKDPFDGEFLYSVMNRLYHSQQSGERFSLRNISKSELDSTRSELDSTRSELDSTRSELNLIKASNTWQLLNSYRLLKTLSKRLISRLRTTK